MHYSNKVSVTSTRQYNVCVKLHLRNGRTDWQSVRPSLRVWNERTDERTNTHGNNVYCDRRRYAVSTSLRIVTNRRTDNSRRLSVRPSVRSFQTLSKRRPSVRLLDGVWHYGFSWAFQNCPCFEFCAAIVCVIADRRTGMNLRRSFRPFSLTRQTKLECSGIHLPPLSNGRLKTTKYAVC